MQRHEQKVGDSRASGVAHSWTSAVGSHRVVENLGLAKDRAFETPHSASLYAGGGGVPAVL